MGILYIPDYISPLLRLNMYTNPGWLCLVIWIIFALVIIIGFDESAYKTNDQKKMDFDNQLIVLNKVNIYLPPEKLEIEQNSEKAKPNTVTTEEHSDGLIDKEIKGLIDKEDNSFSYMRSAYIILILFLLVIRVEHIFI